MTQWKQRGLSVLLALTLLLGLSVSAFAAESDALSAAASFSNAIALHNSAA